MQKHRIITHVHFKYLSANMEAWRPFCGAHGVPAPPPLCERAYFKLFIFEGGGFSSNAVNIVLNQPGDVVVTGKYSCIKETVNGI